MFVMKAFHGYTPLSKMSFDDAVLWVQFHNLPLFGMLRECGERLGSSLGVVEEVEVDEDDVGWGRFLRVKILLNLKKPLARGRTITLQGLKTWIPDGNHGWPGPKDRLQDRWANYKVKRQEEQGGNSRICAIHLV